VAGSGRSGTSLFTGILQRLGYTVPAPEVPADESNPRGFAESQWVIDFHARLLRTAQVQAADSRPAAWALTTKVALDEAVQWELRTWLARQFDETSDIIVKDPRLSWFLPLWRRCAQDVGAVPQFVTMLRHPAAVIDSKQRWYGAWQGEVARAAGWINLTLFTERATRDSPRAFVHYDDLLDDWTRTIAGVARVLDLAVVRDAPPAAMRAVHAFVDPTLSRSAPDWGDMKMPVPLREHAEAVWTQVAQLADARPGTSTDELDALRARYLELYANAEAIAQSSIAAARLQPSATAAGTPGLRLVRRIPKRYRHLMPLPWRARIGRALVRRRAPAASPSRSSW
jgi:hypothetical protein